jgi:hypothetical protein
VWRYYQADEDLMLLDLMFVSIAVLFFLVSWAYVRGCERL